MLPVSHKQSLIVVPGNDPASPVIWEVGVAGMESIALEFRNLPFEKNQRVGRAIASVNLFSKVHQEGNWFAESIGGALLRRQAGNVVGLAVGASAMLALDVTDIFGLRFEFVAQGTIHTNPKDGTNLLILGHSRGAG